MNIAPTRLLPSILMTIALVAANTEAAADAISSTALGQRTMSKFMVNLASFVTWPEDRFVSESAPYKYCMMGDDPFAGAFDTAVTDKQTNNRGFQIERIGLEDMDAAKNCHVVFVNVPDATKALNIIDSLEGLPILTVGEVENFAQYGGMVGFLGEGRKIALAVNQQRLENAGLKGSSRLYRASDM